MNKKEKIKKSFWGLVNNANAAWENNIDPKDYESTLIEILNFIKINSNYRDTFIHLIIEILEKNKGIWEIVAFCMRELKWKEIFNYVLKRKKNIKDIRVQEIMDDILQVYCDEWEDSYMWPYYNKK